MSRFEKTYQQAGFPCQMLLEALGLPPICFLQSAIHPQSSFGSRQTCKAVAVEGDRNRDLDSPRKTTVCSAHTRIFDLGSL